MNFKGRHQTILGPSAVALLLLLIAGKAAAHAGPLNKAAMAVCQEKQRSASCQYEGHHNDLYIGTCQYVTDEDLICVRNKPIQPIDPDKKDTSSSHEKTSPVTVLLQQP
ncbi:hypothetical protein [Alteromonas sp. C1M14]|uniref:hypothetical protein n=1 Tax=Alteromonas sp. C1M14 TaxID=2841567 RepID=UPI001C098AA5|nr:hypothetical protein [Alteromonas sp. C1M14]MBU2978727.1 hypothetical protein [Alteromonas sp. C1M14]